MKARSARRHGQRQRILDAGPSWSSPRASASTRKLLVGIPRYCGFDDQQAVLEDALILRKTKIGFRFPICCHCWKRLQGTVATTDRGRRCVEGEKRWRRWSSNALQNVESGVIQGQILR